MLSVFGSINIDYHYQVENFPKPGETIKGFGHQMKDGGKGANQALAAARFGAKTALVGAIGSDSMGQKILTSLKRAGVIVSGVVTHDNQITGSASVWRDKSGENQIVLAEGANALATHEQIPDEILKIEDTVMMQMEVPLEQNWSLIERAYNRAARSVLNVAPALPVPDTILNMLDTLIVNESEGRLVAGFNDAATDDQVLETLLKKGPRMVVLTLGGNGVRIIDKDGTDLKVPAIKLEKVVDTTGAGDCFAGTFIAAQIEGFSVEDAAKIAVAASGLACTKEGIHDAYPYRYDVMDKAGFKP